MNRSIIQQWHFDHPPALVWEHLTNPALIAQWLMENDFKPIVGHHFRFTTKPLIKMGFDGIVYCEVLEVIPEKKLSYSWKGGPRPGKINLDSVVTWTLTSSDGQHTTLLLEHAGFKGFKNYLAYIFMGKGWASKIKARFGQLLNNHQHETQRS